eukprot:scaffold80112_cov36-Phaeocystis_antarctica.AAC.1
MVRIRARVRVRRGACPRIYTASVAAASDRTPVAYRRVGGAVYMRCTTLHRSCAPPCTGEIAHAQCTSGAHAVHMQCTCGAHAVHMHQPRNDPEHRRRGHAPG